MHLGITKQSKNRKLSNLCYVAEIDLNNKSIGAVIQKNGILKLSLHYYSKKGKEVERYEPGISMRFDEQEVFEKNKKEIK